MPANNNTASELLCVEHDTVVQVSIVLVTVSILLVLLYLMVCLACKKKRRLQEIQLQSVKQHLQTSEEEEEGPYGELIGADDEQQDIELSPASILRQQSLPDDLESV